MWSQLSQKIPNSYVNYTDCMYIPNFLDLLCQNCKGIRKSSPFQTGNVEEETVGPGMFFILPCLDEVRPIMDFLIDFRGPINRAMTSVDRFKNFESLFCLHFYQKT